MSDTLSNQPTDEMARLTLAAREALTDSMVERLASTGANALELLDRLNDERTSAAIHTALDRLTELHKAGALDTLFELLLVVHAMRNAATDNIVERLFGMAEQLLNTVGSESMCMMAENSRAALEEAAQEARNAPAPKGGVFTTLAFLGKPETQRSLAFLLDFSQRLQRRVCEG